MFDSLTLALIFSSGCGPDAALISCADQPTFPLRNVRVPQSAGYLSALHRRFPILEDGDAPTHMKNIIGRKVGMTSVFLSDGRSVPVTVIEAGPCRIVHKKTDATDGYEAVALSFGNVKTARLSMAMRGVYEKAGVAPAMKIREFRRGIDGVNQGDTVDVSGFEVGDRVDVTGISKGHGFAGGMKRHNFSGGGASHGSMIHRQPGSNGDTNSGHTHKGSRRPGHYGVDRTTHQSLEVVRVDVERNLLLVRGPVPGSRNGIVLVSASVKARKAAA
jgi:large subunit ribosomal protein L3